MTKLCFLAANQQDAAEVLAEIRALGISDQQVHAIGNDKTPLDKLPDPDIVEENDVIGGAARGAVVGTATGMLAGLVAVAIPGAGVVAAGSAIAAGALGGASFGVWIGTMLGVSVPNSQLDEWRDQIDAGNILVIVEVSATQHPQVLSVLNKRSHEVITYSEKGDIPLL